MLLFNLLNVTRFLAFFNVMFIFLLAGDNSYSSSFIWYETKLGIFKILELHFPYRVFLPAFGMFKKGVCIIVVPQRPDASHNINMHRIARGSFSIASLQNRIHSHGGRM